MSDAPRTDAGAFPAMTWPSGDNPMVVRAGLARTLERELATETARRERAERLLREFCQENPTRWTRLELMEVRDELMGALKECNGWTHRAIELEVSFSMQEAQRSAITRAESAISAAESHASCIPPE